MTKQSDRWTVLLSCFAAFGHNFRHLTKNLFELTYFSLPYQDELFLGLKCGKFAFNFGKIGHYLSLRDDAENGTLVAQHDLLLTMMDSMDAYPSPDYKQLS